MNESDRLRDLKRRLRDISLVPPKVCSRCGVVLTPALRRPHTGKCARCASALRVLRKQADYPYRIGELQDEWRAYYAAHRSHILAAQTARRSK